MKDKRIEQKVIKGLLKQGYQPDKDVLEDIRKIINREPISNKRDPYFILGLVCDYGFYIGMQGSLIDLPL